MIQCFFLNKRHSKRQKYKWKRMKTFLVLPTAPICGGKGRDDPQLYEPIIHHILPKKKLVDSLKNYVTSQ